MGEMFGNISLFLSLLMFKIISRDVQPKMKWVKCLYNYELNHSKENRMFRMCTPIRG